MADFNEPDIDSDVIDHDAIQSHQDDDWEAKLQLDWIAPFRQKINDLDDQIIDLMVERSQVIAQVGHIKADKAIPAILPNRVDEVRHRAAQRAQDQGLDYDFIAQLYTQIIDFSCELESKIKREKAKDDIFSDFDLDD